ncbi:hypothetical protein [Streptomyces sp. N35]|uniref:hypothetical protein n=1 Tax=Streptomyces sp. N35 TaxID=2795730 RepID=UPI0018F7CA89|nr:hypothetical protein [Streptomyces sp. N35]
MRRLPVLVITAVSALTLAACGSQSAQGARTDARADAASKPKASAPAPGSLDEVKEAFTLPEALRTIETDCGGQDPAELLGDLGEVPEDEAAAPPADAPAAEEPPQEPVPLPDGQGSASPDPEDFGPPQKGEPEQGEKDIEKVETCVFDEHTERVTKALRSRAALTPDDVSAVLKDLGYPAERVVAPKSSAGAIQFTLDLSVPFGPRCLSMGVADGKVAAVPHHDVLAGDGIPESEERCEQRKAVP